jgi:mRNA-degrading endonuclease RelE of RelBE toxin-antitoxin system
MDHPECRLRLDPYRVFYDVSGQTVIVLAIVRQSRQEARDGKVTHLADLE